MTTINGIDFKKTYGEKFYKVFNENFQHYRYKYINELNEDKNFYSTHRKKK